MTDITSFGLSASLLCLVCNAIMKDAMCGPCGHSLCGTCMKDVLWGKVPCITCGKAIKMITPNFYIRKETIRLPLTYSAITQLERTGTELDINCDTNLTQTCMGMLLSKRTLEEIAASLCTNHPNANISCFIRHAGDPPSFSNPTTALNYFQARTPLGCLVVMAKHNLVPQNLSRIEYTTAKMT